MRHPSPHTLSAFARGELDSEELLDVGDHVAACEECAGTTESAISVPTAHEWRGFLSDPTAAGHVDDEQFLAYVRGQCSAADRRLVEEHVAGCPLCREDLADLKVFHVHVAPSVGKIFEPTAPQAPSPFALGELFRRARQMRWLPAAAMAGLAGLAVFYLGVEPLRTQLASARAHSRQLVAQVEQAERAQRDLEARLVRAEHPAPDPATARLRDELAAARAKEAKLREQLLALQRAPSRTPISPVLPTPPGNALADRALETGRLEIAADIRSLQGEKGRLLGANDDGTTFSPLRPVGTVVRSQRPTFRWRPFPGATGYRVMVFDEAFNEAGRGEVRGQTDWRLNSSLLRGKTYHWEVVALRNGEELERTPRPPAPPARFRVLDARGASALNPMRPATPLQRGVQLAELGLLDDAQRELETAAEEATTEAERGKIERLLGKLKAVRLSR